MVAGTGDQESPREQRPPSFPPWPAHLDQVATLLPQGALEDSAAGRLRGLEPLRRETSLLHPGSRQHVAVSSALPVSKTAIVCVGRGAAEQPRMERARGSGWHTLPSSLRSHAGDPRPPAHSAPSPPLACPCSAFPCRPRVQPQLQDAPPWADFTLRHPGVGSRHLAFASLLPHLPTLPLPPKRRITSGKV